MRTIMPYQYTPLDQSKQEIRLIILDDMPTSGIPAHLRCRILPVSLDLYTRFRSKIPSDGDTARKFIVRALRSKTKFPTSFYALSYAWGNPTPVCDIEIDGELTKISRSLGEALLSIRKNNTFRVLWADALCINQADNAEKSWQVQQMAFIFARAKSVISWLGPASDGSYLALKTLEDLTQSLKSTNGKQNWSKEIKSVNPELDELVLKLSRDTNKWAAIVALTARPYWTRVWIFQEMACARQNLFLCGDLLAENVKYPLYFLMIRLGNAYTFFQPLLHRQCDAMIATLYRYEHRFLGEAFLRYRPPRLVDLIVNLSVLDAKDPRDRVFALLSIAEDGRLSSITPDYSRTETAILIETACALLRLGCVEEILSGATASDRISGLPTWVPNWAAAGWSFRDRNTFYAKVYDACAGKDQQKSMIDLIPSYSLDIKLDGYVVGTISTAGKSLWEFGSQSSNLGLWLESVEEIVSNENEFQMTGQTNRSDVLGRLLVADAIDHERLGPEAANCYNYIKRNDPLTNGDWYQPRSKSKSDEDSKFGRYVMKFFGMFNRKALVFRTSNGDVGLTSNNRCREGDLVVIFLGKRIPCVLRKVLNNSRVYPSKHANDVYQLVGEAYVHGLMDGQFFKRNPQGKQCRFTLG